MCFRGSCQPAQWGRLLDCSLRRSSKLPLNMQRRWTVIKLHWTSRKQSLYFYTKNNDLRLEYNFGFCSKTKFFSFYKLYSVFQPSTFMCDCEGGALCGGSAGKIWTCAATQASTGITQQTNHSKNKRAWRGNTTLPHITALRILIPQSLFLLFVYIFTVSWLFSCNPNSRRLERHVRMLKSN